MEQRGIRPGKDIFVTGFDNEPVADELIPHLTTVKADPAELGYNAVIEAVKYIVNGAMENEMVPSSMVCRNSCGCQGNPRLRSLTLDDISENSDDFDERISALLFDKYRTSEIPRCCAAAFPLGCTLCAVTVMPRISVMNLCAKKFLKAQTRSQTKSFSTL